ncbi:uncharacterized protein LOC135831764 isoform X2 [Planococcus citri]|uniref:uncharacterized protein LOC135831764 isoform X2 n=1 Tax=Planococcus citri TaxID=170843 RepID=UPI0031F78D75
MSPPKLLLICVGCGRRGSSGFFKIPKNPHERKIWLEKCGVDESTPISHNARLCIKHFKGKYISHVNNRYNLKKDAVPSIKVAPEKIHKVRRYKGHCYICGVIYSDSFHVIPKDKKIRVAWLKNLGITFDHFNSVPTSMLRLCNSHFSAGDITWHPHSVKYRIRTGAMPFRVSQNSENNETGQSTSSSKANCSKELSENSEVISVSRELVEKEGSDQSTTSSKKEIVTPTMTDLTSKGVPVSSTLECELQEKNKRIRRLEKKNTRLEEENTRLEKLSTSYADGLWYLFLEIKERDERIDLHRSVLDDLLKKNFVTKEGKQMIKIFRQTLENPVQ